MCLTFWLLGAVLALLMGPKGIAEADRGDSNPMNARWNRRFRDTVHLEPAFAQRFPVNPERALEDLRAALKSKGLTVANDVKLALSAAKDELNIDYSGEEQDQVTKLERSLFQAGWAVELNESLRRFTMAMAEADKSDLDSLQREAAQAEESLDQKMQAMEEFRRSHHIRDGDRLNENGEVYFYEDDTVYLLSQLYGKRDALEKLERERTLLASITPESFAEGMDPKSLPKTNDGKPLIAAIQSQLTQLREANTARIATVQADSDEIEKGIRQEKERMQPRRAEMDQYLDLRRQYFAEKKRLPLLALQVSMSRMRYDLGMRTAQDFLRKHEAIGLVPSQQVGEPQKAKEP